MVAGVFDFWSLNGRPGAPLQPAATQQLGFLPAGLGANLAVRRSAFDEVGGFAEELHVGEDIDLCWRLQLRGFRFAVATDAVVAKRERPGFARGLPARDDLRAQCGRASTAATAPTALGPT